MPAIVLRIKRAIQRFLPDNVQWENRFEIKSESSDALYVIAQHKTNRHWACSCRGWIRHRKCKHLQSLGLPCGKHLPPYEVGKLK